MHSKSYIHERLAQYHLDWINLDEGLIVGKDDYDVIVDYGEVPSTSPLACIYLRNHREEGEVFQPEPGETFVHDPTLWWRPDNYAFATSHNNYPIRRSMCRH